MIFAHAFNENSDDLLQFTVLAHFEPWMLYMRCSATHKQIR